MPLLACWMERIQRITDDLVRMLFSAFLLMTCTLAYAEVPEQVIQDAQRLQQLEQQRQQEQFLKDRTSAKPPAKLSVPEVPVPTGAPGACRDVKEIHVSGVTLLSEPVLEGILSRYRNRCLSVIDIEALLSDITRAYVDKGWVAVRAYLPQQDLSQGRLEIVVVEGKVSKIEVDDGGKQSIFVGNVAPFTLGEPLNLRDFEQALDQINRLASNKATIDMRPGEQPGDTVVVLRNEPGKPWHVFGSLDNQGSKSTGRVQGGLTFSLDNPLRLNDFISYTRRQNIPTQDGRKLSISDSGSYVIPFGSTTLSLNTSNSKYESQTITGAGTVLHNSGTSSSSTLRVDQLLHRDAVSRWGAYANLTAKSTDTYLEGIRLTAASRKLTVLDLGLSLNTVVFGGALSLDIASVQGMTWFDAQRDTDYLADSDPRAQFHKWTLGGSYIRPFSLGGQEFQFNSQWSAQYANDVLYGSEQLLIGGIYSVRGFDQSTLSGDHGFYIRNEVGTRIPFKSGEVAGSYRPWVGIDYGVSRSRNEGVPEGSLIGMAMGVQVNLQNGFSLDVFASKPLSKPDFMQREPVAVWVRVSATL